MAENLTQSVEDYIKAIYELTRGEERATTSHIAEYLRVTPASVTGMIKKLSAAKHPLLEYKKHHGVVLTQEGKKAALETLRHHRLLELFLYEILGYPWDEVHEEADRLEHVISEKFEERIAIALGNPTYDPHGDPIPDRNLSLPEIARTRLSDMRKNQHGTIVRVRDTDPDLLRYLGRLGVIPRAEISVIQYSEFDCNTHLKINDNSDTIVLGLPITKQIYVELSD
jgi:DtxR family Mn-dependent transcriptional regulator